MESSLFWQNPFVNVARVYKIGQPESGAPGVAKGTSKKTAAIAGDVQQETSHQIRSSVWKIAGPIPAKSYIQFPSDSKRSLGLVGSYCYVAFKPIPKKYFVFHFDLAAEGEHSTFRISFSNMFKTPKITSSTAQFPFYVAPGLNSVDGAAGGAACLGVAPKSSQWTMFILDMKTVMKYYFKKRFSELKMAKICANCLLKGIYTSSIEYDPMIAIKNARSQGIKSVSENLSPMPREINFVLSKGEEWNKNFDLVRFPGDAPDLPEDGAKKSLTATQKELRILKQRPIRNQQASAKLKNDENTCSIKAVKPESRDVPRIGHVVDGAGEGGVINDKESVQSGVSGPVQATSANVEKRIAGTGGYKNQYMNIGCVVNITSPAVAVDDENVAIGSGLILTILNINTLIQKSLTGHTKPICALACTKMGLRFDGNISNFIISAQSDGIIRIWRDYKGIIILKTSTCPNQILVQGQRFFLIGKSILSTAALSSVSIWDLGSNETSRIKNGIEEVARGSTDQEIRSSALCPGSNHKFATGGTNGVKFWRVKSGNHLRSAGIDFGKYSNVKIVSIQWGNELVLAAGDNGTIFKIDPDRLQILEVHQLTLGPRHIKVCQIRIMQDKLLVASKDNIIRFWTPSLTKVTSQVELDANVNTINLCQNGKACLITTDSKAVGLLNFEENKYTTLYRSHAGKIHKCAIWDDCMATISVTNDLRVWKFRQNNDYIGNSYSIVQIFHYKDDQPISAISILSNTLAVGYTNGKLEAFQFGNGKKKIFQNETHKGGVIDCHFSPLGQLYSIDTTGEIICFDAHLNLCRMLKEASSKGPSNKIKSSPEGRFITVFAYRGHAIQLYSSQLDPLLEIKLPGSATLINDWYFIGSSNLIIMADQKAMVCDISENKFAIAQAEIHPSNGLHIQAAYSASSKYHVTCTPDSLKVWPNNFNRDHAQEYIGHDQIQHLKIKSDFMVTVGDGLIMWRFNSDKTGAEIRNQKPKPLLKYSDQKLKSESNPDETIIVKKKSLFSALDDDSDDDEDTHEVSVIEPTPRDPVKVPSNNAPSPIPFEDNLNITPPGQCSSPILEPALPEKQLIISDESEDASESGTQNENSIRIQKHFTSSENLPVAKSVAFPPSHYIHEPFRKELPDKICTPSHGTSPAITLCRVVSAGNSGSKGALWSSSRGELIYTSGSLLVFEKLENFNQTTLESPSSNEITNISLSSDEGLCLMSCVTDRNQSNSVVIECNTRKILRPFKDGHKEPIYSSAWSLDGRFVLTMSGTYETNIKIHTSWNGDCIASCILPSVINDAAWIGGQQSCQFVTIGHSITRFQLIQKGSKYELVSRPIPLTNDVIDNFFTSMAIMNDRMIVGTNNGTILSFNLAMENFELDFFFSTGSNLEISAIGFNTKNTIVISHGDSVQFWAQGVPGSRIKTQGHVLREEFEIDGPAISLTVDPDDNLAVVLSSGGSIVFLADETLSNLVPTTSNLVAFDSNEECVATAHSNGAVKFWQKSSNRNWTILVQFQTAQAAACVSITAELIAAGYESGFIRIFSIAASSMILKISTHSDMITCIKLAPDHVISGTDSGKIYIHSLVDGQLQKQINDHFGCPITSLDFDETICHSDKLTLGGQLWLASSADRRISVWTSDWSKKIHHLAAWISFPGTTTVKAMFDRTDSDLILYWTNDELFFYSLKNQTTKWSIRFPYRIDTLARHPTENIFAFGSGRLLTIAEISNDRFVYQDFLSHSRKIRIKQSNEMRAFLIGLGLSNQIQADYCNLNAESDHNQPIDSCFCPSGTDSLLGNSAP